MAVIDGSIRLPLSVERQYYKRVMRVLRIPQARKELRAVRSYEELLGWRPYATPRYEISGAVVPFVERLNAISYYGALRYAKKAFRIDAAPALSARSDMIRQDTLRPIGDDAFLIAAVKRNVDLIVTIHPRMLDDLRRLTELLSRNRPFDQNVHREILRRLFRSTGYNQRRITRDQANKLHGQLAEQRQRELGITSYVWRTAEDERVRPTHAANNGKKFDFGNPPSATGPPGNDIQCRCIGRPLAETSPFLQSARPIQSSAYNPALSLTASTVAEWRQVFRNNSLDKLGAQVALLSANDLTHVLELARQGDPVARRRLEEELAQRMAAIV